MFRRKLVFIETIYILVIIFIAKFSLAQIFSSSPDPNFRVSFDGTVKKIIVDPETNVIYVGGSFRRVNMDEVALALPISATSSNIILRNHAIVKPPGIVRSIISDNNNGWYLGGRFDYVYDPNTNSIREFKNLVHILADGSIDLNFRPNPNGEVTTLALYNQILYVGGYFTKIAGGNKFYLAALDLNGNLLNLFSGYDIGYPFIEKIVIASSTIYVGGNFDMIAGENRTHIAAFDLNGNLLNWRTPIITSTLDFFGLPLDPFIYDIVVASNTVYVGGFFNQIGNATRTFFAAFDAVTGNLLPIDLQLDGSVFDLELVSSTLYLAGSFEHILGATNTYVAAVNLDSLSLLPFNPEPNYPVHDIEISSTSIYLGGSFTKVKNEPRSYLAAVDLNGNILPWLPPKPNDSIGSINLTGNILYVGGGLFSYPTGFGGQERNCFVAIDGDTGQIIDWDPNLNYYLYPQPGCYVADFVLEKNSLAAKTLFIGGNFEYAMGATRTNLAAFDVSNIKQGNVNLLGWNPMPIPSYYSILTMASDDSRLYVGGYFTNIGGNNRKHIAAFSLRDGLLDSWNPNITATGSVQSIAVDKKNGNVYFGGSFDSVNNFSRYNLAAVDSMGNLINWAPRFSKNNFDVWIAKVFVNSSTLYVAGDFDYVDSQPRKNLAAFDLTQSQPVLKSWYPNIGDIIIDNFPYYPVRVNSFFATQSILYFGGRFAKNSNPLHTNLAAVNLNNDSLLNWGLKFNQGSFIYDIAIVPGYLYAGGYFSLVNSSSFYNLVRFNELNPPRILNTQLQDPLGNIYNTTTLPAGTTQVIITFNTDRPSVCKYSLAANIPFEQMIYTALSDQTNTSHRVNLSSLNNNTRYQYFFKCQDIGNPDLVNFDDYLVSFSIGSPSLPPNIFNIKLNNTYTNNSTLPANTNQVTLTFNTDKPAICRYATFDTNFDNMTNNINFSSDKLSHSTIFSGLQNNTTYTYYLRCQNSDDPTIKNDQSFIIRFFIALASSGGGGGGSAGGGGGGGGYRSAATTSTTTISQDNEALRLYLLQLILQLLSGQKQKEERKPKQPEKTISKIKGIPAGFKFTRQLKFGMKGKDVRYLQVFLKSQGKSIYPEGKITGIFGTATRKAVIRFQEKYKKDILIPQKLKKGTGIVDNLTLKKINQMLE